MPRLNQRGAIQFIIPIILLLGIIGVVYLVTKGPLKIFPKASVSGPLTPTTSFTLEAYNKPRNNVQYNVGEEARIDLYFRSDITQANLLVAKLQFPPNLLEVTRIDHSGTEPIISNWVEEYYDNTSGEISLVGGMPNPGYKTEVGGFTPLMTRIFFKTKSAGTANIIFTDDSAIYGNADNTNILTTKDSVTLSISSGATPPPYVCSACDADINQDGVVTILDFSSLAACFNKEATTSVGTQSCSRADINGSGRVTIEDFNCLADKFNKSCSQGAETGPDSPMDQETRRSLQAQLEKAAVVLPPSPVATPVPGTGDGNGDGKINLVDLSVLLSDFNKETGFRRGIDLNGDGKINTFDFSLMRNLLIQKGVIRG